MYLFVLWLFAPLTVDEEKMKQKICANLEKCLKMLGLQIQIY